MTSSNENRGDPFVPILASAVAAVVLGSIVFVFYPRVADWIASQGEGVRGGHVSRETKIPVWICRSEEGVALMLESYPELSSQGALRGPSGSTPREFLLLSVYNFAGPEVFSIDFERQPFRAVDGLVPAEPASDLLVESAPANLKAVLRGLGALPRLDVPRGRTGQALFVLYGSASRHASYAVANLQFDRKQVAAGRLAGWRRKPDWKGFQEF